MKFEKVIFWVCVFAIFSTLLDAITTATALSVWPNMFYESVPISACIFNSLGLWNGLANLVLIKCLIIILFYYSIFPNWIKLLSSIVLGMGSCFAGCSNLYLILDHILRM